MIEKDNHSRDEPVLQRVRCRSCGLPLVQVYQRDLLYTLQRGEKETIAQTLPAYAYRALADPAPLLFCPRCSTTLSPATVTVVPPKALVVEESKTAPGPNDL